MSRRFDYNLVVIGAGSAGLVTSYIAAATKAKVALIERDKMGGDCLNTGCVPSKALIKTARFVYMMKHSQDFGVRKVDYEFDFFDLSQRISRIRQTIEPHDSVERYAKLGVDCFKGEATLLSPHEVKVDGKILTTKSIVLATGAMPRIPEIEGLELIKPLTSDTLWNLKDLPKRLMIVGGGPIGCEMAQAFTRLGTKVTMVDRGDRIMSREDADVSSLIQDTFRNEGIDVIHGFEPKMFKEINGQKSLFGCSRGGDLQIAFDEVLFAVGRKARVRGFGLSRLNIKLSKNETILVNEYLQTSVPNIYACGDAVGPYQFTHMAAHQAWYACVNALFGGIKKFKVDYSVVPWCTFTDPEVATVGLNETTAAKRNIAFEVTKYHLDDLDRAIVEDERKGFVKILTVPRKDKILGATIVGAHAGEQISELISAMKNKVGLNKILSTIHIYPTWGEANKFAAGAWKRAHAPELLLSMVRKFHNWSRWSL